MARENPILPSEPLSLEPNLIAAAVIAEELDNQATNGHQDNVPRNASKVRRRLDNRHYGRSESRGHSEDREHKERHSEEHYSPRRTEVRGYHRSSEDHDSKRYRITGQAAAEESGQSYYTNRRYVLLWRLALGRIYC
ncbi:hypothetical protein GGI06_004152 [Coemansia sp. S85]|nr:hypothetical protein GGI06_004152 [Coemansia sp. S85]